ncbi:S-layer domain-containing protein [[Leptolyngbya] sp. PCC 7376]|uniref:S-layer homology domain-containing protein n=1 Tax=[Leptolyngbya] sp. PCC 7376 TaxID=111781 RepID=UPI00029F4499|nr:S-layer homology domain-containing protein [[Leptolyngbya] sp. PCC 7376]AFY37249.1 S-layer domain-containing protein [[Leptolyngbya] sp. PCC 7376]
MTNSTDVQRLMAGCLGGAIAFIPHAVKAQTLTDINDHWAERCIQHLEQRDIVQGYPDQTFRPNEPVTRTEFAAFLNRAFPDSIDQTFAQEYRDLDETYWGLIPIDRATRSGFMTGYPDGTFKPTRNIPRYETLLALVAGLNYVPQGNPQTIISKYYEDAADLPAFAYPAIAAATEQQLIVNYPNLTRLNPQQWASRAEVASFLCRALDTTGTISEEYIVGGQSSRPSFGRQPSTIPTLSP